jgi:type IV pilus assembly protein PilW
MKTMNQAARRRSAMRGFTLVELMIAILIGLFLTAGLLTLVGAMKRTTTTQTSMSQLQDSERIAMSLIATVVETAGYFPNPAVNSATTFFLPTSTGPIFASGQAITGAANGTLGDSISLRYTTSGNTAGNDNALNCTGNTSATQVTWTNTFTVDANGNLLCTLLTGTVASPAVQLVSGVTSMTVWYGVQSNAAVSNNSVDTYVKAANVPNWSNVLSVKITLNFKNPLAGQPGQPALGTPIAFTRVISLMNKTGVDL